QNQSQSEPKSPAPAQTPTHRRSSTSTTTSTITTLKIIRIINTHLEPSLFDTNIREQQIALVKGCLSEVGVYASVGVGSVSAISSEYIAKSRSRSGSLK